MKTAFFQTIYFPNINAPTGPAGPAITPGPVVADEDPGAGTPELVDKINELLASLRTAGVIAT